MSGEYPPYPTPSVTLYVVAFGTIILSVDPGPNVVPAEFDSVASPLRLSVPLTTSTPVPVIAGVPEPLPTVTVTPNGIVTV
jgi:hypothetical protein